MFHTYIWNKKWYKKFFKRKSLLSIHASANKTDAIKYIKIFRIIFYLHFPQTAFTTKLWITIAKSNIHLYIFNCIDSQSAKANIIQIFFILYSNQILLCNWMSTINSVYIMYIYLELIRNKKKHVWKKLILLC